MQLFGEPWNTLTKALVQVQAPVGELCTGCDERIAEGETGIVMPHIDDKNVAWMRPQHKECFLRGVLGSVGHQLEVCTCAGKTYEDPPGMTKRQAAVASNDMAHALDCSAGMPDIPPSRAALFETGLVVGELASEEARQSVMALYIELANGMALNPNSRPLTARDLVALRTLVMTWCRFLSGKEK